MKTYLFFDLETSGLDPAFDQVLTFAGIRTDPQLREIDRTSLTIQMRKDIVPSPHAFITHCLYPEPLADGLCEYEAARILHALFNTKNTISVGYNSLGFDDEFLRFMFYRNLLDPYSHQYANGCSRADILPVTTLFKIFCEPVISWPRLENGRSTLKLELIASENRFTTSGHAHEAMADVEALVALCRAFFGHADIWDYAMGFFDKSTDMFRTSAILPTCRVKDRIFRTAVMVSPVFGPDAGYLAPVLYIGDSIPYGNQQLWIRLDQEQSMQIDPETGLYCWAPIRKKPADQWIVLPCMDRFRKRISGQSRDIADAVLHAFQSDPHLFFATMEAHLAYAYPKIPDIDPDAALYQDGFFSPAEKKEIARFHVAGPFSRIESDKAATVLDTLQCPRIKTLGARILARNFNAPALPEFEDHLHRLTAQQGQITGYRSDAKYTLSRAMEDLAKLRQNSAKLDARQKAVLDRIKTYLDVMANPQ
ncbi:MAG: exonuclease domain-containing protein [Desulfotignum sp.]|nr:exodeoxyribonuclease I [Desulfobacteraceae bacterium]